MKDANTKKSRGFGFVTYYNITDSKNAKEKTNHTVILSKPIRILWKKPLKEMSPENNIFVKNVDKSTTEKEFESVF